MSAVIVILVKSAIYTDGKVSQLFGFRFQENIWTTFTIKVIKAVSVLLLIEIKLIISG